VATTAPLSDVPVLTFLGGTGTVTGSKFLVETPTARVLVDCGLFQGEKALRLRNWDALSVDPASIDAVVLTHAHVDHCGYVPRLVNDGFRGPVVSTPSTAELCGIVLPDSGHLQEEEAEYANRKGFSRHKPALALYTEADARRALRSFEPLPFRERREVAEGIAVGFRPSGHILGSAITTLELGLRSGATRKVTFSGDLGRPQHPVLVAPDPLDHADVVLVESTYGDREHDDTGALERLADAVRRTAARGGMVVIPAFAVDRTEVLLVHLRQLRDAGAIPDLPIFVDSPMALATLGVYKRALADDGGDIRAELVDHHDPFGSADITEVRDVQGSMELDRLRYPAIIVSASGMATGGRVLHHLARYLPNHRNTIVLVGFQAAQTRGRQLADGARQVKLLGRYVPVRAEVVDLPSFSVHADRSELVDWLSGAAAEPEALFLVHGEPDASAALQDAIVERLGWDAVIPSYEERVRLD
jgi:metallo-beta-lactamase family protein